MRKRRVAGVALAVVGVLLVAALAGVGVLTNTDWGRGQVRTRLLSALEAVVHGTVQVGALRGNLLRGITLTDVRITDSTGAPFLEAAEVHTGYALRALLSKRIELHDVRFDRAVIVLDRPPDGEWNYARIFPRDTTAPADTTPGFGSWIVLTDVDLRDSRLLVRTPWRADSTLTGAARDSAVQAALSGEGRTAVIRRPDGGYQQVQDFRDITARLPLIRLAHPEHPTQRIEVDSLRMQAFAFAPPAAEIRQLAGTFELNGDSLWFPELALTLPGSQAQLAGRYEFTRGDLALRAQARPVALADARFLYPALPERGSVRGDVTVLWENGAQRYMVRGLDLTTDSTRVRGDLGLTLGDTLTLHDTSLEFSGVRTALLEQLVPGLDVPREGTLHGRAIIGGTATAMQVDGDVTFDDRRAGRSRVIAAGEIGAANGVVRARGLRVSLAPLQVQLVQVASPSFPLRGQLSGRLLLDGETDATLRARDIDLTHVEGRERSQVTGRAAIRLGDAAPQWLDARLVASPLSLRTVGRFAPAASLRGAVSGPVEITGPWNALAVDAALRSSDGGRLAARGTIDLASRDLGYAMDIRTELLDLNALSDKAPRTSLSALLQTRARGTDPARLRGTFAADVQASSLDTFALDALQLRARADNGLLRIDSAWVSGPGTFLDVRGTFGLAPESRGDLTWRARVDSLSALARYLPPADTGAIPPRPLRSAERLAAARRDSLRDAEALAVARAAGDAPPAAPLPRDTAPTIARDSLAGRLTASGRITGNLDRADLSGVLEGLGIVALGSSVQRARVQFGATGLFADAPQYRVALQADSLLAAGFALDSVSAQVQHGAPGGNARIAVHQNDAREYALQADYAIRESESEVLLRDMRLRFDTTTWRTAAPGAVRWGQPGFFVDSLDLRSGTDGRVFAHGLVPNEGAADLRLIVNNFQLGDLLGLLQSDVEGAGRIMVDTRVTGSGRAPRIDGRLSLLDARYRDTPVPNVEAELRYAGRLLDARAVLADTGREVRPVARATAQVPVNLAFFDVQGPRLLDAPASGELVADSLPLDLVNRVTDALQDVRGAAAGRVTLQGPVREPTLNGTLALRDARAHVTSLGVTFDRINGAMRLNGDTVRLDSLVAWSSGRLVLAGGIGVQELANPTMDLRFDMTRARVLDNDQGRVRADAAITVRGPLDNLRVEGNARVRDGVLYIPKPENREVISAGDPTVFAVVDTTDLRARELVPSPSPLLANLQMDLTLGVDRDVWVRSPEANIEVYTEENLRIQVDRRRSSLSLDGVVNTDRGEYEFLGKRFQVKRGAVQFTGTRELNPLLQITGEYAVEQPSRPTLNIQILVGGTLQSPRLTLESDAQPPISQSDLLSYLAFGSESGSLLQFGGSSLAGGGAGGGLVGTSAALATKQLTGVALGVAVDQLEGQAARSLGADVFTITPANVPPELASGNFGALSTFLRGTRVEYGKYVDTRTFLGLQLQAATSPGFRVERQLGRTPGLTLEATLEPRFFLPAPSLSEQEITKANALGLFLRRRWRF